MFSIYLKTGQLTVILMNFKQLAIACLVALIFTGYGANEPKGQLITETYIVKANDTLYEISYHFMTKSSVRNDVREFRDSIIQLNWETVFKNRSPYGMIFPGDQLKINYYVCGQRKKDAQ